MNTIQPHSGVAIPKMIYGTAWKKERTSELVALAIKNGFRGVDTACQPKHYAEPLVGQAIKEAIESGLQRKELFIQTKFTPINGQDPQRIPYDPRSTLEEQLAHSFKVSQQNLNVDVIDSYLLHSPLFPHSDLMQVWRAMEKLYDNGSVRQLGISNIYDLPWLERLYEDARVKPAVVQNRFYRESGYDSALRTWCDERKIVYQGFWTLTANPHLLGSREVFEICRKYTIEPPQVLYAYLSQNSIVPLNGTSSQDHMQQDLGALDLHFTPEEISSITALL